MIQQSGTILALDVGSKRIGVARASSIARIANPLATIANDETVWQKLQEICKQEDVFQLVVGLPRGLNGQETEQTKYAEAFTHTLASHIDLPIKLQDEAVTSHKAEAELTARGKQFEKGDIDALAAVYILEDYLIETS